MSTAQQSEEGQMSAILSGRKIGAIVVGRRFGTRAHVPALRAAGFDVLALVGRDMEKTRYRARQLGIPHACASLAEALQLPGVDAVTIAAPPVAHAELVEQALAARRHVICEKPFATSLNEAQRLHELACRAGVVHLVGHEFRWNPARVAIGEALRAGQIGAARLVSVITYEALLTDPVIGKMPAWFHAKDLGGGWIGAAGSHAFDQIYAWLGPYDSLSASAVVAQDRPHSPEDSFTVRFRMRCGAEGVVQGSGAAWADLAFTAVSGTRGTLTIEGADYWTADAWIHGADGHRALAPPAGGPRFSRLPTDVDPWQQLGHIEVWHYTRLCQAFRRAIEGHAADPLVPMPTFAAGVASMRVIDAVRRSAANGGAVVALHGFED
jgi:predicted dehydrogenase